MGLLELLIVILVLAAILGGIAVSPVLFVLLIVALLILFTRGGLAIGGGRVDEDREALLGDQSLDRLLKPF